MIEYNHSCTGSILCIISFEIKCYFHNLAREEIETLPMILQGSIFCLFVFFEGKMLINKVIFSKRKRDDLFTLKYLCFKNTDL